MHLNIAHIQRVDSSIAHNPVEHGRLVPFKGSRDGVGAAAVVGIRAADDAEDGIVVFEGILEAFENDRANGVRTTVAIRLIVKGVAVSYSISVV